VLNPAPFFGVAVFQVLTGAILDRSDIVEGMYSFAGFKNAFLLCLLFSIVCMGFSFFIRKPGSGSS